ncbi:MAG: putative glycolipid-binding domain-containing protein, partial [Methylobacteriaceae bacterium]|nr:putative glycolipid-binding domain-containing protein [Methylobacteriaceae bacterium]
MLRVHESVWEWLDGRGLEHVRLEVETDRIEADGLIVAELDGRATRIRYRLHYDGGWAFGHGSLEADFDARSRRVELAREHDGGWVVDGIARPDLGACSDIDIMASPFTNTPAIRKLAAPAGTPQPLRVAYIRIPDLTIGAFDQEYTRLDALTPPQRVRYRSVDSGFTADLTVDEHGLVIDYSGLWRRRGSRDSS